VMVCVTSERDGCDVGVRTGECIASDDHPPNKSCEIYGWCPVEQDALPVYVKC